VSELQDNVPDYWEKELKSEGGDGGLAVGCKERSDKALPRTRIGSS